jgi:hypothetical protein
MKATGVNERGSPVTHPLDRLYEFARIAVRAAAAIPDARDSGAPRRDTSALRIARLVRAIDVEQLERAVRKNSRRRPPRA